MQFKTKSYPSKIAVIGLGYVGLPLAVEFSRVREVIGFDIDTKRVTELKSGQDSTLEVSSESILKSSLTFTTNPEDLRSCDCFIVTVPTPVDTTQRPDLKPLLSASTTVGSILKRGDLVIFESTVYPGCTEEDCVPVLERASGLKINQDFFCGYSPERVNPGDKERKITQIKKITSGSTPDAADTVDALYREIITAGTHKAPTIRVAEAAKVIENTQRDVNIALINELAIILNHLAIDTQSVLEAAGTKWNFLPFRPGLVGGHCIGIDPYYLKHKAQTVGYHPEIISAVRRLNDGMSHYIVGQLVKAMIQRKIGVAGARILIMGLAFKENCPDLRNTKVVDIVHELEDYGCNVDIYDPWVSTEQAREEYSLNLIRSPEQNLYDGIILAVAHNEFRALGPNGIKKFAKEKRVIYDIKYVLSKEDVELRI